MPALKDLSGQRFGKLVVISREPRDKPQGDVRWRCQCDCGNETVVSRGNLLNGSTSSCRCLRNVQGGHSNKHPLWRRWENMIDRCENADCKDFPKYGGRGIYVCERWHSFPNFIGDMEQTFKPGLSLDRIDNDGPYSPENCRWANEKVQGRNRRTNVFIDTPWGRVTVTDAAQKIGISVSSLFSRIKNGWAYNDIFDPRYAKKLHKSYGRFSSSSLPKST